MDVCAWMGEGEGFMDLGVGMKGQDKNSDNYTCAYFEEEKRIVTAFRVPLIYIYHINVFYILFCSTERDRDRDTERYILYIMQCFWYQFCLCYALFKCESFIYVQFCLFVIHVWAPTFSFKWSKKDLS